MIVKILSKLRTVVHVFRMTLFPNAKEVIYRKWLSDDGENTLRYSYDLNENSVVFDVGGYKGDFAAEIFARYRSSVFIFEPVEKYAHYCEKRFSNNPNISIFPCGLGSSEFQLDIEEDANRTQMKLASGARVTQVQIKSFKTVVNDLSVEKIDLLKINIEGGEYELLENIYQIGYMGKIANIQVQFHDFIKDSDIKRRFVHNMLKATHDCNWSYEYIWENWKLRS